MKGQWNLAWDSGYTMNTLVIILSTLNTKFGFYKYDHSLIYLMRYTFYTGAITITVNVRIITPFLIDFPGEKNISPGTWRKCWVVKKRKFASNYFIEFLRFFRIGALIFLLVFTASVYSRKMIKKNKNKNLPVPWFRKWASNNENFHLITEENIQGKLPFPCTWLCISISTIKSIQQPWPAPSIDRERR